MSQKSCDTRPLWQRWLLSTSKIRWHHFGLSRARGYFKKSTRRVGLTWSASVDVVLCFGWIDGMRKTIDDQSFNIRFTPRKKASACNAVNAKKVKGLFPLGRMKPARMRLYNNRTDTQGYTSEDRNVQLATEYEEQIKVIIKDLIIMAGYIILKEN